MVYTVRYDTIELYNAPCNSRVRRWRYFLTAPRMLVLASTVSNLE